MTDTPVQEKLISEDELMRLAARYYNVEVVNGEVIITDLETMSPVGVMHLIVATNLYDILRPFVRQRNLGVVFSDGLIYILDGTSTTIKGSRVPDVSYVSNAKLPPPGYDLSRPFPGSPDLAVEVISPNDKSEDTAQRIEDYFHYGTQEVWVIYPNTRTLMRYSQHGNTINIYKTDSVLDAAPLLPGLAIAINDLWVMPFHSESEVVE